MVEHWAFNPGVVEFESHRSHQLIIRELFIDIASHNLFRVSLTTIQESAKDLNEIEIDKTKENLSLIKKHITICEKLLGEELGS